MAALEFCLPPEELPALLRQFGGTGRAPRPIATDLVWHDTGAADLAADRMSLCEDGRNWRLERSSPGPDTLWPPGTPAPLVAEAPDADRLGPWPGKLMPVASFHGQRRTVTGGDGTTLLVLQGVLRGVARERAVCRVQMQGSGPALQALSSRLAQALPIELPRWSMATEAAALARGHPAPSRRSGSPSVPEGMCVGDALGLIIGHLTDVILAGVPVAAAGENPEGLHDLRVAVRRLRSALSVFRRAADGPDLQAVVPRLQRFASALGPARDWDVFLAGTGQQIVAALPDDPRLAAMFATARRQRDKAYDALRRGFASADFRILVVNLMQLAALRPWEWHADDAQLATLEAPAVDYAAALLSKRHKHMLGAGADIGALPTDELHDLRKQGKKLRYAAECFAPLFGRRDTRRFVQRLSQLQEALGHLNDAAAASALMDRLGGRTTRQFATGAVVGFTAACNGDTRALIARQWTKFRKADPFWR